MHSLLFEGNLLEWGQLFSWKCYGEGAIFRGAIVRGAIIWGVIFLGNNCLRTITNVSLNGVT